MRLLITADTPPLAAALAYAERGWHVFPLHTPQPDGSCSCNRECGRDIGKHPRTMTGLNAATTNSEQIAEWWEMWPTANIGIRTGAISGLVIVDADGDQGWQDLRNLEADHGIPDTIAVNTGSGGLHLYLKHPGGTIQNSTKAIAPGLDVRGDGGYAVAPPSLHHSGTRYSWDELATRPDAETTVTDPGRMPEWMVRLIVEAGGRKATGTAKAVPADGAPIAEGSRNDILTSLGGTMRRRNMIEREILAALLVVNERCVPPLDPEEVAKIAASVMRYSPEPTIKLRSSSGGWHVR